MDSKKYYDKLYKESRDEVWNDAPGKKVVISGVIDLIKNKTNRIIDIGCGNGNFISEVRNNNPIAKYKQYYYGIDISKEAILKAEKMYDGVGFRYMDALNLDYDAQFFDIILSYGVIEHVKEPQKALNSIYKVLKGGGLFMLMLPSLDYYRNDRTDEGWYEDLDVNRQPQWNYLRKTWEGMFNKAGLILFDVDISKKYGALKPGVFFFGEKKR